MSFNNTCNSNFPLSRLAVLKEAKTKILLKKRTHSELNRSRAKVPFNKWQ